MGRVCQVGRFTRRCRRQAVAVCQYCGRDFCDVHVGLREGGEEVCSREICLLKHEDLKAHLVYRTEATNRSNRGFCAAPDCAERRSGQCSKCQALFCERHLHAREETFRQGLAILKRPISVCDHCAARIKLWSRH